MMWRCIKKKPKGMVADYEFKSLSTNKKVKLTDWYSTCNVGDVVSDETVESLKAKR